MIKTAENFQDVQKQMGVALKAAGVNVRSGTKSLTEYSEALAVRGGFTSPENLQGLTTFVRITHDVTKAEKLNTLATNIARGTHESYSAAVRAVMMSESGPADGPHAAGHHPAQARQCHEGAGHPPAALRRLHERHIPRTAAGAMHADFQHTIEQLGEEAGRFKLIPPITKVFQFLNKLVDQFERGKGLGGQIRVVFEHIGDALKDIWGWLKKVEFDHLGEQLKQVGKWATSAWKGIQNLVKAGFKASKPWAIAVVAALGGLVGVAGSIWLIVKAVNAWKVAQGNCWTWHSPPIRSGSRWWHSPAWWVR